MALIKCSDCDSYVSTEAKACQKCGAKVKKPVSLLTKILLFLVFLVIALAFVRPGENSNQQASAEKPPKKISEEDLTSIAKLTYASPKYNKEEFLACVTDIIENKDFQAKKTPDVILSTPCGSKSDSIQHECLAQGNSASECYDEVKGIVGNMLEEANLPRN